MKKDYAPSILDAVRKAGKRGLTAHELLQKLRIKRPRREEFYRALGGAVKSGALREKKERFVLGAVEKLVTAKIVSVKGGFGFAQLAEGEKDLFIPGHALMGALPGDLVLLRRLQGRGGLPEGEVVRITQENAAPFSGVLQKNGSQCEIVPDKGMGQPVRISPADTLGARGGDKVLAQISRRGESHFTHRAQVTRVFGSAQSAAACSQAILAAAGITPEFPEAALRFARRVENAGISPQELERRVDLRGALIFTIDGADTKDIDDAVSLTRTEGGWALGVHIADVSHYVKPGTVLDAEAYERGTSVYYASSVVPMLPPALSNGICSLNPWEDRLAFSALMTLDESGRLTGYTFQKTVICSRLKGVYAEINKILEGAADRDLLEKYGELIPTLRDMRDLAAVLQKNRRSRGALDLESAEAKILVGPQGEAQGVLPRESGLSEHIIEELMLTANEAAASYAQEHNLPFIYRIHEDPPEEKLETLIKLLDELGLENAALKAGGATSGALASVLEAARGKNLDAVVNHQLLRSMAKARYSPENKGHFGLVLGRYTHFTSPIRRYPDLAIHRILSSALAGMPHEKLQARYTAFVQAAAEQSSNRELRAMTAERDCEDCYKAEYMRAHLGEGFDGIISGVSGRGVFVRLQNTVEGLVRLESLPEGSYDCDGVVELRELQSGMAYRVGMAMRVTVAAVDVSAGRIDFVPEEPKSVE